MATPNANVSRGVLFRGLGPALPPHDHATFTYVGSTNNVSTITARVGGSGGVTVGVLTFTYVASGAADDDDITTCVLTTPTANG